MSKKSRHDHDRGSGGNSDGIIKGSGVNYAAILDHRVDDSRHERQKAWKSKELEEGLSLTNSNPKSQLISSTFDAFQRMATGKEGRKIAEKLADPNRPTWEEYKKVNEDKLDMVGQEIRKMTEYRAELDRERDQKLASRRNKKRKLYSDSEGEDETEDEEDDRDGDEDEEVSGDQEDDESEKKRRKRRKKEKKGKKEKKKKDKKSKKKKKKKSAHSSSSGSVSGSRSVDESNGGDDDNNEMSKREKILPSPIPCRESPSSPASAASAESGEVRR